MSMVEKVWTWAMDRPLVERRQEEEEARLHQWRVIEISGKKKVSPFYIRSFIHDFLIFGIMLDSLSSSGRPSTSSPVAGSLLLLMVMTSDGLICSCFDSDS